MYITSYYLLVLTPPTYYSLILPLLTLPLSLLRYSRYYYVLLRRVVDKELTGSILLLLALALL